MVHGPGDHARLRRSTRLLERLDAMVERGRLTPEDADRLRAAAAPGDIDNAIREIQLEHARARVNASVEDGLLTEEEAQGILARLSDDADPGFLRSLRCRLRGAGRARS